MVPVNVMRFPVMRIALYFIVWAVIHSILTSRWFKRLVRQLVGAGMHRWYRFAFVVFALITLYFIFGSFHEEQLLVDEYGAAYLAYRRQVPRFVPWPGRVYADMEGERPS